MDKNILIIGTPNTGKTHFGGQLYGRLKTGNCSLTLKSTPDDLSIFQEILEKLNTGLSAEHTATTQNENLILPVQNQDNESLDLIYPDYGGEQITNIVENRKINSIWKSNIEKSDCWFLFIRLSLVEDIEDVTTRFYSTIGKNSIGNEFSCLKDNSPVFYIELLQIFLFAKRQSKASHNIPKLTILLSCWDELPTDGETPESILRKKMPLFYDYISSLWRHNLNIIGLSSTGKPLSVDKADNEYLINGPEKQGYIILEDGQKNSDLTLSLNSVIT